MCFVECVNLFGLQLTLKRFTKQDIYENIDLKKMNQIFNTIENIFFWIGHCTFLLILLLNVNATLHIAFFEKSNSLSAQKCLISLLQEYGQRLEDKKLNKEQMQILSINTVIQCHILSSHFLHYKFVQELSLAQCMFPFLFT